jgi:hypothetical protein
MMKSFGFLLQILMFVLLCSCSSKSDMANSRLTTGYYKTKRPQGIPEKRYVLIKNDTVWAYLVKGSGNQIDTAKATVYVFPKESVRLIEKDYAFSNNTWDFNFQTIIFKYRPAMANIPNQLNTEFNLGRRADSYRISYLAKPLELNKRKITHFGYSFGFFTGLGETPMSNSVTQNQITYIYDGVIWLNGVSAIIGINSFTLGTGIGIDQLLDRNRNIWIYERKPWVGLMLGIKLK